MLIEYSVSNFRSFGESQTFSLVASKYEKNLPENKIKCSLPGMSETDYLNGAAVYGANASGKTNLFFAMAVLRNFIARSFKSDPDEPTCAAHFKLDGKFHSKPTTFEIQFVVNDIRHYFSISLTEKMVIDETLVSYPKGKPRIWYKREWEPNNGRYVWEYANGQDKSLSTISKRTRNNVAFLSKAADDKYEQLMGVYNWFTKTVKILNFAEDSLTPMFTIKEMEKSQEKHNQIISLLRTADFDIVKGLIREKELSEEDMENIKRIFPPQTLAKIYQQAKTGESTPFKSISVSFFHHGTESPVEMEFENEESAGTKRYFSFLGPLLDVLDSGNILFVDELETCLHPLLVVELIKLFRSEYNTKGAQLIFTTHNPLFLDETLLRRDQIWFTEKETTGETHLYPLTDFSPRKGEALTKGYLAGRYGGVPFIPNGLINND